MERRSIKSKQKELIILKVSKTFAVLISIDVTGNSGTYVTFSPSTLFFPLFLYLYVSNIKG